MPLFRPVVALSVLLTLTACAATPAAPDASPADDSPAAAEKRKERQERDDRPSKVEAALATQLAGKKKQPQKNSAKDKKKGGGPVIASFSCSATGKADCLAQYGRYSYVNCQWSTTSAQCMLWTPSGGRFVSGRGGSFKEFCVEPEPEPQPITLDCAGEQKTVTVTFR